MRRVWLLALLSVVACSKKQEQGSGAVQDKFAPILANKDEKCPGGTVKGCLDEAAEAEREGAFVRAVELYTRVCDAGVARACNVLGLLVWQGRGASEDPARSYSLYVRACDGGDSAGCFNASVCHTKGVGAEKNDAEATRFLRRACDAGDVDACADLRGG